MNKYIFVLFFIGATLFGMELPLEKVKKHDFYQRLELNSQIIQLSSAKQEIMSQIPGHIERYYVVPTQKVKKGDRVALIDSIALSKMSAQYLALKKQFKSQSKNLQATRNLYEKGMTSLQKLNEEMIKTQKIRADLDALASQLDSLGIDIERLQKPTSHYILRAHTSGVVASLAVPLHSVVTTDTTIVSIVKKSAYYAKTFLPLRYAKDVKVGDRVVLDIFGKQIPSRVTQILPKVDEETKRVILLSSIQSDTKLFIGAYVASTLHFGRKRTLLAVKKNAVSFFNNEWVVFVPKEEEHHEEEHQENEEHGEEEHEHHEAPFEARVVKIVASDEHFFAVEGLQEDTVYVSDQVYFVKSALLKGALGGHGH